MIVEDLQKMNVDINDPKYLPYLFAKTFTRESGKGLLFYGPRGNGKTTRMEFLSESKQVPLVKARKFGQAWIDLGGDTYEFQEFCHCENCRWSERPKEYNDIIIDDLGLEEKQYSRYGTSCDVMLNLVLPMRYEAYMNYRALTHITTNLTMEQIHERYGDTVWSRLNKMCVFIPMTHGDRRMENSECQ